MTKGEIEGEKGGGGERWGGREWGKDRKDSVFLLNKKLFLLNFSSLKPVLLFKGEEAQNCLAECIYECSKVFSEKRQKVKETGKKFLTLHRNPTFLFSWWEQCHSELKLTVSSLYSEL